MSLLELAKQKTTVLSGGNQNYYLFVIPSDNGSEIVGEVEDVIEYFNMNFALATCFKSLMRLIKLRQDLGKPGSTKIYESEKIDYYSKRSLAYIKRKIKHDSLFNKIGRWWFTGADCNYLDTFLDYVVTIDEPKRLEPYSFSIEAFINALGVIPGEMELLKRILMLVYMRTLRFANLIAEQVYTEELCYYAHLNLNLYKTP